MMLSLEHERVLPTGYLFIRLSRNCFAQIPPGFAGETIPDEYIFQPEWTREKINYYWKTRKVQL